MWEYLFDFYMLHSRCRYYSYSSPGRLVWKIGTEAAPPPRNVTVSLLDSQTPTRTLVWSLTGEVQPGCVSLPSLLLLLTFFISLPPIFPPSLFLPKTGWSSSSPLSVTRVISLCYFICLSNESNPSAFHCSAAQIMRTASPLLSHTSPLVLTLSLPTLLLMDEGKQMCVRVCLSMWSTQSCQVLCASFLLLQRSLLYTISSAMLLIRIFWKVFPAYISGS